MRSGIGYHLTLNPNTSGPLISYITFHYFSFHPQNGYDNNFHFVKMWIIIQIKTRKAVRIWPGTQ